MTACIIGWGHTRFGKLDDMDLEALIKAAGIEALADAGVEAADVDEIFLGTYNGGMDQQEFAASLVKQIDTSMRFTPRPGLRTRAPRGQPRFIAVSTQSPPSARGSCWPLVSRK